MLPSIIENNLKNLVGVRKTSDFREAYAQLSESYRNAVSPVINADNALAYACARMPATYAVIEYVIDEFMQKVPSYAFRDVLDIGSGTGALMCYFLDDNLSYSAIEKSKAMIEVSRNLIKGGNLSPEFQCRDVMNAFTQQHDCAFFVYSLNEMKNKTEILQKAMDNTVHYVFIIEAGTPNGFEIIKIAKQLAVKNGWSVIAPCATENCPLTFDDWCHFSVHVPRSQLHNLVKNSSLPYEDEKFSYIILSRTDAEYRSNNRVIKRPMKKKGHAIFDLCTREGVKRYVSSDKSLRKVEWGEEIGELK